MFLDPTRIEDLGYAAIALGLFLDGATIPFTPVELFLVLAGYVSATGNLNFYVAFAVTVLSSMTGHLLSYTLGYKLGNPFFKKYGKYLFIQESFLLSAEKRVKAFGPVAAIVFRFIPGFRSILSILLGIVKVPIIPFTLLSLAGVLIWNLTLMLLGYYFGIAFAEYASLVIPFILGICVAGLGVFAFLSMMQMKRKRKSIL